MVSSLVSRPEIFCWVLVGRTPRSLMLFVGQIRVSVVNRSTSSSRSRQNSSRSRPGCWAVEFFGPGMRGTADRPTVTARRNSVISGSGRVGGDRGQAVVAGDVPGVDQAAQRPLRLGGPVRVRVGLGGVLVVPEQVGQAGLVPGDVLPAGVPVVDVPVGDDDAGEVRQDPEVAERLQGRGRPGTAASTAR